jgi:hypothetical protein
MEEFLAFFNSISENSATDQVATENLRRKNYHRTLLERERYP